VVSKDVRQREARSTLAKRFLRALAAASGGFRVVVVSRAHALVAMTGLVLAVPATASSQATAGLRVGTPGNDGNALAYYAFENGTFRKYGITVEIQTIRSGSGAGIAGAVIGGALDIGEGDIIAVAAAREHGLPLLLIAPSFLHRGPAPITALVVAKNSPIRTGAELNGATIAVPSLTGPAKLVTVAWLQKNGTDVASVKFVELPQLAMAAAIKRGTVAAGTTSEPSLAGALDDVRVLGYVYDAIGNPLQVTGWFATEDWIRTNADVARRFVTALRETAVWANNPKNHAASAAILEKYTPFNPDILPKMHRAIYGEYFDPATVQPLLDAAYDQKSLQKRIQAKDLLSSVAATR
jgi:NitT/TauT family transport system substrate-binding protein